MAIELLAISEEHLEDFIYILRCGMDYSQRKSLDPTIPSRKMDIGFLSRLNKWCDDEERYINNVANI